MPGSRAAVASGKSLPDPRFPLKKVISPRGWKLGVVVALALVPAGVLLSAPAWLSKLDSILAAEIGALASLPDGPLARLYGGVLLALSAQLALIVWWARSRSLRDFGGRYRVWIWASLTLCVAAACLVTGLHRAGARVAAAWGRPEMTLRPELCWMLPAGLWGLVMLRGLHRDMRGCRTATALLWVAVLGWTAAAAIRMSGHDPHIAGLLAQAELGEPQLVAGLSMLGWASLFASLLTHARYVVYVSPEAPPLPVPLWQRLLVRWRRRRMASEPTPAPSPVDSAEPSLTLPAPVKAPPPAAPDEVLEKRPVKQHSPAQPAPASSATAKNEPPDDELDDDDNDATHRLDGPQKDALKGLSKRERRKLRKEWREQQRESRVD
ncbi:MAG: hypothetical protein KY476_16990 [Planctomycetes bacterium]|nr:hypothetical protein [Planctomycetota bacterium]